MPTSCLVKPDINTDANTQLYPALQELYGFTAFRPYQEEIVRAIMAGRDAFVVMPTGGGKSLCYQLPAHLMPGVCLVISPLISLMKDQVDAAIHTGLRAAYLNSSQKTAEQKQVLHRLEQQEIDLLYVSPERFSMEIFKALLDRIPLAFVAIDEAHCISEWGHDFRPDYLNLCELIVRYPQTSVAAFTATATLKVQQDIVAKLGLRNPFHVRASFNRPNLHYRILPKTDPERQLLQLVRQQPGQQGIIYRTTRSDVENTAAFLQRQGIHALPYHAGMKDEERAANQEAFNRDEIEVIVATIAFGMGIDKSNVRFVYHGDLPKNIESYYQETGRAGRDGEPAECVLLFSRTDESRINWFIDRMPDHAQRAHARDCLDEMLHYASRRICRRRQLLRYFNETYPHPNCGRCDVCAATQPQAGFQPHLLERLRTARKHLANEHGLPPFVVLSDRTLRELATRQPVTLAEMSRIHGIGTHKLQQYGPLLINVIQDFHETNEPI
jgi:ATP-dependent DNA helicase RecQ